MPSQSQILSQILRARGPRVDQPGARAGSYFSAEFQARTYLSKLPGAMR